MPSRELLREPARFAWAPGPVAIAGALMMCATLGAQVPAAVGTISGTVRDSAGAGIAGADIAIVGTKRHAESGVNGAFRLSGVAVGMTTLRIRRIGFKPVSVDAQLNAASAAAVSVHLTRVAQELPTVVVNSDRPGADDMLHGFNERRRHGFGHFVTREEIDRRDPIRLTDMLRDVPGLGVNGSSSPGSRNRVRFRGMGCAPIVWIDGFPAIAAEVDLDALLPKSIEAIEIYSGAATVPVQFMGSLTAPQCGAIVIWSRIGEPRKRVNNDRTPAAELAALVDSSKVFTADQVDIAARPDSDALAEPTYPDSLYRAHVDGLVVAEFVVDTTGDIALDQFNVVSTTNPLFTDAVRRALPSAKFVPARRAGRLVRQVVQWPFKFVSSAVARR